MNKSSASRDLKGIKNAGQLLSQLPRKRSFGSAPRQEHSLALLEDHRLNQLPVVKDGMLVGIVTDRDLRDAFDSLTSSAKLAATVEPVPETSDKIRVEIITRSAFSRRSSRTKTAGASG
jgi:CBS-domain-containing membrane protein